MQKRTSHFRKSAALRSQMSQPDWLALSDFSLHAEEWILSGRMKMCSERTLGTRKYIIAKLKWFLDKYKCEKVSKKEISAFLLYVAQGYKDADGRWGVGSTRPQALKPVSKSTVHTFFTYLRAFANWLVKEGITGNSIMKGIETPGETKDQITPFSVADISRMIDACQRTSAAARNECIVRLLFDCGLRCGELVSIQLKHIQLNLHSIRVLGKGSKERTVFFGDDTRRSLYKYLNERGNDLPHDYLLVAYRGSAPGCQLGCSAVRKIIKQISDIAGVKGVRASPHTLRHSFAVEFLKAGGGEFSLRELLGHTSLIMTNRYVKFAEGDMGEQHRLHSPGDALRKVRKDFRL